MINIFYMYTLRLGTSLFKVNLIVIVISVLYLIHKNSWEINNSEYVLQE